MNNRLIKSNDAGGGGACTNTVDLYNPFPDGGGVALYQLNGDATDVSGNYNGTASNVTYGTGQFGQAAVFNGSSSKIQTGYSTTGTSTFSFSWWMNLANTGNRNAIISDHRNTANDDFTFFIEKEADNDLNVAIGNNNNAFSQSSVNILSYLNKWSHFVVTINGTSVKVYADGAEINSFTSTISYGATNTANYYLGTLGERNLLWFQGSIDQVRIFNRALRPYEVEALYTEEYCTPTIVPSEHFNTVTYTGNGGTLPITGVGFKPDFVWAKGRSVAYNHWVYDTVRGANAGLLPNLTNSENTTTGVLSSLDSDGFTLGSNGELNQNNATYVAWNFKAGGAAVTNTDGTITSQVSANTEAGFSIVSYTGNGTQPSTIGHGLNSAPKIVMNKCRSLGGTNWHVYSSDLGATSALVLNDTAAAYTGVGEWGSNPDSSVLYVNNTNTNNSGRTYISYCFAEVEGFSNFGSYAGTGSSVTQSIITGFEPAWVMIKDYSAGGSWWIEDNKRGAEKSLKANSSDAESIPNYVEFLENGFTVRSGLNDNSVGSKFIYMAFAADPTAVEPTLEDSFNTVLFTGNGSATQAITGVGFQPDLFWIKNRQASENHYLNDSVMGTSSLLRPNLTSAAITTPSYVQSFDLDGITFQSSLLATQNYVGWAWKGAEIPAINSNGSIPSVVSANPAAGFSIVSWTGNGVIGSTVGHGLTEVPEMIIVKNRTSGSAQWSVYHSAYGATKHTLLNTTDAASTTGDWNNTEPTNSVITFNNSLRTNASGNNYIAYVFHSVAGFSKFGFWQGGTTSIDLGFEPAFVLNQDYGAGGGWGMFDSVRGFDKVLAANSSNAEATSTFITPNATGFTVPSESSIVFRLYMAFANQF